MKAAVLALAIGSAATLLAQDPPRPRPFPGGAPPPATQTASAQRPQLPAANVDPATGVALYPGAQLLGKFDASPSQQFYVYGTSALYATVVEFYKTVLKEKGRQLFDGPMHQFDTGRYRKETMTLQPGTASGAGTPTA